MQYSDSVLKDHQADHMTKHIGGYTMIHYSKLRVEVVECFAAIDSQDIMLKTEICWRVYAQQFVLLQHFLSRFVAYM